MALVLKSTDTDGSAGGAYRRLAAGLALRLRIAEVEGGFVSSSGGNGGPLDKLLSDVFTQINTTGSCRVPMGKDLLVSSTNHLDQAKGIWMTLKYSAECAFAEPPSMQDSWTFAKADAKVSNGLSRYEVYENDLAVQRVWQAMNGRSTVSDLVELTGLEIGLTKRALWSLLKNHCIVKIG